MSKPVKGTTRSKTGHRRSHHALKGIRIQKDAEGNASLPHQATPATGMYKGKTVLDVAKRLKRRIKKLKPLS
ncbi:MAG: 50S ribosomal protein L32 [Candidatus Magasanikbacteria bacterium]|jgi:ribosomal protein L32|nr:50S ribosomal protein L32 [Candidatus Magasanikbacteria bacterium]